MRSLRQNARLLLWVFFFFSLAAAARAADVAPGAKKENSLIDPPEVALRRFTVAPGLKVDLFAAEPDVRNPVAVSVDERGRVFVVESDRRRSSVFDIRGHKDWLETDLSFRTVRERADFLKQQVSPTNPAVIQRLTGGGRGTFADFNQDGVVDWRDLEVQTERIRLLEDTNGDGRADRVSFFADGFTNIVAGVAAGVLARGDDVYFACIPDLWRLRGSGSRFSGFESTASAATRNAKPETRNLLSGFGVHIAFGGHDMHGLIFGPDGKLYWSIADRGTDTNLFARIKNPIPGLTPELLADSGCVFRANPDGSDFEVIAWGLRNPQELAFDEYGNLFTADNNGDGGDKARWHYVVEGADFGWRIGWQWLDARAYQPKMGPWNGERLWHLAESNTAAWLLPPLAHIGHGPAGLAYNPGTGLPSQFDRHFFLCDFPGHVLMWTNIPDGASFKIGPVKNFFGDLGPTDVAFHPDGGVLVSDWFKSFDKSDKGRIYRIHDPATDAGTLVQETKRLLAEAMAKRNAKELADLLGHADMRVRLEVQEELRERMLTLLIPDYPTLPGKLAYSAAELVLTNSSKQLPRFHAIWTLASQRFPEATETRLVPLLRDTDPEVRAQAAWSLANSRTPAAIAALLVCLKDDSVRVSAAAASSLGHIRSHEAVVPLLKLLADSDDLYRRHSAIVALARIGDTNALLAAASGAVRSVRLGVLLALRRLGSPEVARFLSDPDLPIVLEAARAINDVPIPAAFPQLAGLIARDGTAPLDGGRSVLPLLGKRAGVRADQNSKPETRNSELECFTLRRALNANFRLGHATNAQALASFAGRSDAPEPLRIEALELLADWPKPPARDHIMGLYRPLPPRDTKPAADALRPVLVSLLRDAPKDVKLAGTRAAVALGVQEADLFALVADTRQSFEVRVEALKSLAERKDSRLAEAIQLALADESEALRIEAMKLQGTGGDASSFAKILESGSIAEKQSVLAALASAKGEAADALVAKQVDALLAETLPKGLALDVLEAAATRPGLKPKLAAFRSRWPKDDVLGAYRPVLDGGNAENGRKLFIENQQIACFRCHKVKGEGGDVGPELTGLSAKKGREYILESIVYPNKQIAADYENLMVTLKNGTIYAGQVKQATEKELLLNSPEDGLVKVATADIKERQRGLSAMPEELVTYLSKRELRDLVEFLATLK